MLPINNDLEFRSPKYEANMASTSGYNEALYDVAALCRTKAESIVAECDNASLGVVIAAIYKELAEEITLLS